MSVDMPRGWYRVGTQSGKLSEGNKKRGSVQRMKSNEGKNAKKSVREKKRKKKETRRA